MEYYEDKFAYEQEQMTERYNPPACCANCYWHDYRFGQCMENGRHITDDEQTSCSTYTHINYYM